MAFGGLLWDAQKLWPIKLGLCWRRAFSPSTRLGELAITRGTLNQYLNGFRAEHGALNTRHLLYLMYKPAPSGEVKFKASENALQVMELVCKGYGYSEIASKLDITVSGVEKTLDKLKNDNWLQTTDELVILYAKWEYARKQAPDSQ